MAVLRVSSDQAQGRLVSSVPPPIIGYFAIVRIVQVDTFFLSGHKSKIGLRGRILTRFFADMLRIMLSSCPQSLIAFHQGNNVLRIFKVAIICKDVKIGKWHLGVEFRADFLQGSLIKCAKFILQVLLHFVEAWIFYDF